MESNERDKGKVVGEKEAKQADQNTDSDKKDPLKVRGMTREKKRSVREKWYNFQMGTLELTGWWAGQATDEEVAALSGRQICRMTYQMINDECSEFEGKKRTNQKNDIEMFIGNFGNFFNFKEKKRLEIVRFQTIGF